MHRGQPLGLGHNGERVTRGVPLQRSDAWQAKCRIKGKMECLGTCDKPEEAAALLLPHFCYTSAHTLGVRGSALGSPSLHSRLTPVPMCDHVQMGSEEGSLSAELTAASQYKPPFSPLRRDKLHIILQGSGTNGSYRLRKTRGLATAEQAAGGINRKRC